MELPQKILDDVWEYCRLNKITDVDGFIIKMVKQGFTVEKYGATPSERIVEKEVEKIVEVPVEKIVEVIKEVDKIIEKEVYITNDEATKELTNKINSLENDIKTVRDSNIILSKETGDRAKTIMELNGKIIELTRELDLEKEKPKEEVKKDIYGESKKGFFGSNINDIWKNKNK